MPVGVDEGAEVLDATVFEGGTTLDAVLDDTGTLEESDPEEPQFP